jgi:hypothetical protein
MENGKTDNISVIKKVAVHLVFVAELFFLFTVIKDFVNSQKYFSLSPDFAVPFALILLITLWTIGVIAQTLNKKWEIFVSPAILFISSFIFLSRFKIAEAIIGAVITSLYFLYTIQITKGVNQNLIKTRVRYSGKFAAKGFLLAISVITAISVFLTSKNLSSLDVGDWAADMMEKPLKEAVEKEFEKENPEQIKSLDLDSLKESNPQIAAVLNSFGINEIPANISLPENTKDSIIGTVKNSISSQVNKTVEPYRVFFNPTLALLVFGALQIYNYVIYFVYSNTVAIIIAILKKLGFIKIRTETIEKEFLRL